MARSPWRSRWSGVRFVTSASAGLNATTRSSWNELTSATIAPSAGISAACSQAASPMLPQTHAGRPVAATSRPASAVVVLLPFVPVIATHGARETWNASSSSATTGTPRRSAAASSGAVGGTPGLVTTMSAPSSSAASSRPAAILTPRSSSAASPSPPASASRGRASASVTGRPRPASRRAAARPERAAPTTSARRPVHADQLRGASGAGVGKAGEAVGFMARVPFTGA